MQRNLDDGNKCMVAVQGQSFTSLRAHGVEHVIQWDQRKCELTGQKGLAVGASSTLLRPAVSARICERLYADTDSCALHGLAVAILV